MATDIKSRSIRRTPIALRLCLPLPISLYFVFRISYFVFRISYFAGSNI